MSMGKAVLHPPEEDVEDERWAIATPLGGVPEEVAFLAPIWPLDSDSGTEEPQTLDEGPESGEGEALTPST